MASGLPRTFNSLSYNADLLADSPSSSAAGSPVPTESPLQDRHHDSLDHHDSANNASAAPAGEESGGVVAVEQPFCNAEKAK